MTAITVATGAFVYANKNITGLPAGVQLAGLAFDSSGVLYASESIAARMLGVIVVCVLAAKGQNVTSIYTIAGYTTGTSIAATPKASVSLVNFRCITFVPR
jgi:hypothetical protein